MENNVQFPSNTGISICLPYSQVDRAYHPGSKSGNSKKERKEGRREYLFMKSTSESTMNSSVVQP